jgi:hypothetical protein
MPPDPYIDTQNEFGQGEGKELYFYIDENRKPRFATSETARNNAIKRMITDGLFSDLLGLAEGQSVEDLNGLQQISAYWNAPITAEALPSGFTLSLGDPVHNYANIVRAMKESSGDAAFEREQKAIAKATYLTPEKYLKDGKVTGFTNPEHNRIATKFHEEHPVGQGWYVVSVEQMLQERADGTTVATTNDLLNAYNVVTGETALFRVEGGSVYNPDDKVIFAQTSGVLPAPQENQKIVDVSRGTDPENGRMFIIKAIIDEGSGDLINAGIEYIKTADGFMIDPLWEAVPPNPPMWTEDGKYLWEWDAVEGASYYDPDHEDANERGFVAGLPPSESLPPQLANMLNHGIDAGTGMPWYTYVDDDNAIQTVYGSPQDKFKEGTPNPNVTYVNGVAVRQSAEGNPQIWDGDTNKWVSGTPPSTVSEVMEDGTVSIIDINTGEVLNNLGAPYSTFTDRRDFTEDQRQFNVGENRLDREFAVEQEFDDRQLAAQNYFSTLNDLGANYRTLLQTSPQLANAATEQGKLVADILASGGDVLARTFFTRGGISPLPEITQSDLLQNLSREFQNIAQFEADAVSAENQRQAAADDRRATEEFNAYERRFNLDRQAQFGEYVNEMQPTTREETVRSGTNQAYTDAVSANAQASAGIDSQIAGAQSAIDSFVAFEKAGNMSPELIAAKARAEATLAGLLNAKSQLGTVDPNDPAYAAYNTRTVTTQPDVMSQSQWNAANPATPQSYEDWLAGENQSFTFANPMNVPQVPTFNAPTQQEIINWSDATAPPAVQAMFRGTMPTPLSFGDIPVPTLQQLNTLTPAERQMYNTNLLARGNVDLDTVRQAAQTQFGAPSMDRSRDLAKFRGYSV